MELTKEYLIDARIKRGLHRYEIAKESGWKESTVKKYLAKYKINFPREILSRRKSEYWKSFS